MSLMRFRAVAAIIAGSLVMGAGMGLVIARLTTWDPFALSAHQLDVIRTMGGVAGVMFGALTAVNTVFAILSRKWAKRAADQTSTTHWVNGEERRVAVVEYAKHAGVSAEAARQETADLGQWVRGSGRRRLATADLPIQENSYGD